MLFVVFGALWIYCTVLRRRLGKNVLLIYLVKGLNNSGVCKVIILKLATLADESFSLNPLFNTERGVD